MASSSTKHDAVDPAVQAESDAIHDALQARHERKIALAEGDSKLAEKLAPEPLPETDGLDSAGKDTKADTDNKKKGDA